MSRQGAFATASTAAAAAAIGIPTAIARNVAAAAFGACVAAVSITLTYWAMRDWLGGESPATGFAWVSWSPRRRIGAGVLAALGLAVSIALGPLVSGVLAVALALLIVLGVWVAWLSLRSKA